MSSHLVVNLGTKAASWGLKATKPKFVFLPARGYSSKKELKRFYKNVTISQAEDGFEVNLDKRKLKTPLGKLFRVPTEALALAVAAEWDSQKDVIKKHKMHLTSLSNTSIDNPTHRRKDTIIGAILEFLDTDTVCYRLQEPLELAEFQHREWDPLIDWVKERYGVELEATTGIGVPLIPNETKDVFRRHLSSYNEWALVGYEQAVDLVKSFIIASALINRDLTVEKAVALSFLEQEFQVSQWGNIEWHHDITRVEVAARLAAATLFVYLNSSDTRTIFNKQAGFNPV